MRPLGVLILWAGVAALAVMATAACGSESPAQSAAGAPGEGGPVSAALSDSARDGEELFNANCSACHGANAAGTDQGPTLIDRIYHPNHHSDFSFVSAATRGVPQHHWGFGDMPPVPGVSPGEVAKIVCYVRHVQRAHGIFDDEAYTIGC